MRLLRAFLADMAAMLCEFARAMTAMLREFAGVVASPFSDAAYMRRVRHHLEEKN